MELEWGVSGDKKLFLFCLGLFLLQPLVLIISAVEFNFVRLGFLVFLPKVVYSGDAKRQEKQPPLPAR